MQTITWLEQIGLLVVTATVTTLVTIFIKEKFAKEKIENGDRPAVLCQFHALLDGRMIEINKAVEIFAEKIKKIVESYHSLDKKIEIMLAKDSQRFKLLTNNQTMMATLLQKLNVKWDANHDQSEED